MKVSSKPNLRMGVLLEKSRESVPDVFPFNTGRCTYYYSARYALAAAVSALRLSPHQTVLLPAYNCWVEIDPVVRQRVKVEFYRVNTDFSIDVEDVVRRIEPETAALIVIHYLGFPQRLEEIRRICTERGIILIEDCAHALLSNDGEVPLGSTGDMAIFSQRKTLPIPDGGCLVVNNLALAFKRYQEIRPDRFATYYFLSEMLGDGSTVVGNSPNLANRIACSLNFKIARLARFGLKGFHKLLHDRGGYLVYPNSNSFRDVVKDWGMSEASSTILNGTDCTEIKERRRVNFTYLLEHLGADERFTVPFHYLPDGVCPLFFPIVVNERDRIYRKLKERGFSGHDWWGDFHPAVPWDDFPDSVYLKKSVFGFPIHQDITFDQLNGMLEEFETCLRTS